METSGDWSIYDVSELGKQYEADSLRVATENVELSVENTRLRELLNGEGWSDEEIAAIVNSPA